MTAFAALADPVRRQIVELLADGELPAGAIVSRFDISQPAVSQHLKILRDAHVVHVRAESRNRFYSLDPRGLREVDEWLARTRRFWSHRLDALERALRSDPTDSGE